MFYLNQDQAFIALHYHTKKTTAEIKKEIATLKTNSPGQYSVLLMPTGNKLDYEGDNKFSLRSYEASELDNWFIYDSLELLEAYKEYLTDWLEISEKSIETKQKCYEGYKASIE